MSADLNTLLDTLIKKRFIVFSVLGAIILISLGIGYVIQTKETKSRQAAELYDKTWQGVYTVLSELKNPKSTEDRRASAKSLYKESIKDLDTIVLDYPTTPAAAQAALLVIRVSQEQALKELLDDQEMESAQEGALDPVKKAHPKFWASALSVAEGIRFEKEGKFAEANTSYEEALDKDRDKFISDFLLVSIARNKEILQDKNGALKDYQKLVADFPDSPWNNLALGKIYILSQNIQETESPINTETPEQS